MEVKLFKKYSIKKRTLYLLYWILSFSVYYSLGGLVTTGILALWQSFRFIGLAGSSEIVLGHFLVFKPFCGLLPWVWTEPTDSLFMNRICEKKLNGTTKIKLQTLWFLCSSFWGKSAVWCDLLYGEAHTLRKWCPLLKVSKDRRQAHQPY
jgi:hypothetical protein